MISPLLYSRPAHPPALRDTPASDDMWGGFKIFTHQHPPQTQRTLPSSQAYARAAWLPARSRMPRRRSANRLCVAVVTQPCPAPVTRARRASARLNLPIATLTSARPAHSGVIGLHFSPLCYSPLPFLEAKASHQSLWSVVDASTP